MTSSHARARLTAAISESSDDLLRFFLRRLEREDAADAVAEVMATAWKRVNALPTASDEARMWLFGIARNVLLHARRGNVRRSQLADKLRTTLSARSAPPADAGLDIRTAIDGLDDDLAELVRLVHWDGFTSSTPRHSSTFPRRQREADTSAQRKSSGTHSRQSHAETETQPEDAPVASLVHHLIQGRE